MNSSSYMKEQEKPC